MPVGRSYITYMSHGGKKQGLTFAALVMMSLMMSKKSMKCSEIASDLASGRKSDAQGIYASIHYALQSLETEGYVRRNEQKSYSATTKGDRIYRSMLNTESKNAGWRKMTDSKYA